MGILGELFPQLETLYMTDCDKVTDEGLRLFAHYGVPNQGLQLHR
jgi:hypothetical protein